jgi:hypothetical protein
MLHCGEKLCWETRKNIKIYRILMFASITQKKRDGMPGDFEV